MVTISCNHFFENYIVSVKTPCVGVCSTGIGDSICRGCKRYQHEVIAWNGYSANEKQAINSRLDQLVKQVMQARLVIVDETLLRERVAGFEGAMRFYDNAYMQVFEVIKCLQHGMDTAVLRDYGVELRRAFWALPLRLLFKEMDDELYALSQAHYERYFGRYTQVT